MENKVLITGYNGFTGQYIIRALEQAGFSVFGLVSSNSDNHKCFKADLNNKQSLQKAIIEVKPDYVIHLAAKAFVGHGNISDFYTTNLIGTRNLLEVISENLPDIKHVIIASSANVYGNTQDGCLNEKTIPNPANDYAISKIAMEYVSQLFVNKLPITITRPFNYTGIGQDGNFLIPKIIKHFKARADMIELGNIEVWREFNDVRYIADLYVSLLNIKPGEVINLCSGKYYALKEIVDTCTNITGHRIQIKINPNFVRENEVRVLAGDPSKLNKLVNVENKYTIENTLRWMLEGNEVK
ncbi:GDP-mannose 4,6-dehydratase [Francisella uliginis]|uniref:GDP-mannose 4,6 dehydratase n=1 Tax=Francisella uliginis TaxID=573570 RepID=A0A1L4BR81_9GAMM|nr:GDP-mannose 4,6-dehydratase [Francisella uliginis]API86353.1 GDP-mannose 4,6 dehydratase [Francisella uliginis]